jgi:kanamycin kinase
MALSGVPPEPVPVPPAVCALARGRALIPVWQNDLGGLTWRVGDDLFVKWAPAGSGLELAQEAERLRWAGRFSAVPVVLDCGDDEAGCWLLTVALPGATAVHPRWRSDPATAVVGIGTGLRALHEELPVAECPYDWSAAARLSDVHRRADAGSLEPAGWHPLHAALSLPEVLARLAEVPDADQVVVCSGDACSPNTLLADDGSCSGHVDLGQLGVADRWADLAVATWSTQWNYGPGWEEELLAAYGVAPDPVRTAYYRLLWDAGP